MGVGAIAGKVPRFRGRMSSGETFVIIELLDPSDSICFKKRMRREGLRNLLERKGLAVRAGTFRSRRPTEKWMKQVANLDPDWWYISGHFGIAGAKNKVIVPRFPKKNERWRVTIESVNFLGYGAADFKTFGLQVKTRREIVIDVENDKFSSEKAKTTFVLPIKAYSKPPDHFRCRPVTREVAGSGTDTELERYDQIRHAKKFHPQFIDDEHRALKKEWKKIEKHKTSFAFPKTYSVKVERAGRDEVNLVFRLDQKTPESIDRSIGYVVAHECDPGRHFVREWERRRKRKWTWEGSEQTRKYWKRACYDRFIFSDVKIMLEHDWLKKYDYPTLFKGGNMGWKRCPKGTTGSNPKNTDEIKVELIKRSIEYSADASFFNQSYYRNEYRSREQSNPNSWHILMEYATSRDELKAENFFEEHGKGSYSNAKVVLTVSCNTLVLASVRRYLSQLFPKAIILGHVHKNPANATPIIKNFLDKYFSEPDKARAYDWNHVVSSWLSYHDGNSVKNNIMKRGYGLAALYGRNVYGIDVDRKYPRVLARSGESIQRFRLKSISQDGRKVDVLLVWDINGKLVIHRGMYEGDKTPTTFELESDPYSDPESFPYLSLRNLARNRGY